MTKVVTVRGKRYEVGAFHPRMFEKGVYSVSFHEIGQLRLDRFMHHTQVIAKNPDNAIRKAKAEFEARGYL